MKPWNEFEVKSVGDYYDLYLKKIHNFITKQTKQ